jgi:tetratricopeptide (TPR) repeat protein
VPLYKGKPLDVGGYFQGGLDANVMLLCLEGFEESSQIVYHEFTHLLLRNAVRSLPTWLNEGLAEYYSGYTLESGGKSATIGRPLPHHVLLLRERYLPLAELIAVDHTSPLYNEGSKRSIFYAESWALTHYVLTQMPNGPSAINRYGSAIAEGRTPDDAFRDAFGATPVEFDKALRAYVARFRFNFHRARLTDGIGSVPPGPPRTMTAAEANAWLGDLQRRTGRETEAAARIEAAVRADPDSPIAHVALGLLRVEQERRSEALDALEHAAQLAPDDFLTQFVHGSWLLRIDRSESGPTIDKATTALKRAVEANSSSADAYGWLAYAQMLSKSTLGEAHASIDKAVQLAPGRLEFLLRLADIRILEGDYDRAKALLTRIAAVKIDAEAVSSAEQPLERLARFERAEALRNAARREAEALSTSPSPAPASTASRSAETARRDAPPDRDTRVEFMLRKVRDGEDRAFGMLVRVDCTPNEVLFHVRAAGGMVTAVAQKMDDVELTQFTNDKDFSIGCGPRAQPDTVYLTWRREETPVGGRVGVAVALEFLPRGYVP